MEKARGWEKETLIEELKLGRELTEQLKSHLDPLASPESCEFLTQKIISSYEKALTLLNWGALEGEQHKADGMWKMLQPLAGDSPRRVTSEALGRSRKDQCHGDVYKKRKTMPQWAKQVRVSSVTGLRPLDDGYSWRKYGQKDILRASFPRAYFRCTHRNVHGCLATKQVQRSDEDPSIFEVTYRGRHTCVCTSLITAGFASTGKEVPNQNKDEPCPEEENQSQSQAKLFDFGTGLEPKTEDLGMVEETLLSFSFPLTPIESRNVETNVFDNLGMIQNLGHSESDLTEIISAPTSVSSSPIEGLNFSIDEADFYQNFPFDTSGFFS